MRWLAFVLAVSLVTAALFALARAGGGSGLSDAVARLRAAPPALPALLFAITTAGPLLTAASFWVLTARYGRVGYAEMTALISVSWLLNFLPIRPGLFGRLAYHRTVNGIPLAQSVRAVIWANVLSMAAAAGMLALLAVLSLFFAGDDMRLAALALFPVPVLGFLAFAAHRRRPAPDPEVWRPILVLALRLLELHLNAARLSVSFAIFGQPIGWGGAIALASITTIAGMIAVTGNGVGIREWLVALAAPLLPLRLRTFAAVSLDLTLASQLAVLAVELMVAIPMGGLCALMLWRRARAAKPDGVRSTEARGMQDQLSAP